MGDNDSRAFRQVNLKAIDGAAVAAGAGVVTSGTQRVTLASDDPLVAGGGNYPALGTPTILSVSGTSAATGAALAAGKYILWASVDCWWTTAASPTAVWETTTWPLQAGAFLPVTLTALKLAAITNGGTGKLAIIPVS
jgi:hypothetical protein